jgi:hypothetical protein
LRCGEVTFFGGIERFGFRSASGHGFIDKKIG